MKNYAQMFGLLGLAHSVMFASRNPLYFSLTLSIDDDSFSLFYYKRFVAPKKTFS